MATELTLTMLGKHFSERAEMAFLTGALAAQRERERAAAKLAKGDVARRA